LFITRISTYSTVMIFSMGCCFVFSCIKVLVLLLLLSGFQNSIWQIDNWKLLSWCLFWE